jgi:hypothetical protein
VDTDPKDGLKIKNWRTTVEMRYSGVEECCAGEIEGAGREEGDYYSRESINHD